MTTPRKRAPGGGAKPKYGVRMIKKHITLLPYQVEYLATVDANTSEAVRIVIDEHREQALAQGDPC